MVLVRRGQAMSDQSQWLVILYGGQDGTNLVVGSLGLDYTGKNVLCVRKLILVERVVLDSRPIPFDPQ